MPLARARGERAPGLPFFASTRMADAGPPPAAAAAEHGVDRVVAETCATRFRALADCGDDAAKCADAAIALQHCIATVVCPDEAATFAARAADAENDPEAAERAYAAMDAALDAFQRKTADARRR